MVSTRSSLREKKLIGDNSKSHSNANNIPDRSLHTKQSESTSRSLTMENHAEDPVVLNTLQFESKLMLFINGNKVRGARVQVPITNRKRVIDEVDNEKEVSAGKKKKAAEEESETTDTEDRQYDYLQVSPEESAPAVKGIIDVTKLSATLIHATGGPNKVWNCPKWIADGLRACRWKSGPLVKELNKQRGQFLRRKSGSKAGARRPYTEAEGEVLWRLAKTEMAKIRCIGNSQKHMAIAYARITRKFNEQMAGKTAKKGEDYLQSYLASARKTDGTKANNVQKTQVVNAYQYVERTELAIKTACWNLPCIEVVMSMTDNKYILGDDSDDSDGEDTDSDGDGDGESESEDDEMEENKMVSSSKNASNNA